MIELRELRERLGLTMADVAARTDGAVTYSAIGRIERGERSPSLDTLRALARVLDVEVSVNADRRGGVIFNEFTS